MHKNRLAPKCQSEIFSYLYVFSASWTCNQCYSWASQLGNNTPGHLYKCDLYLHVPFPPQRRVTGKRRLSEIPCHLHLCELNETRQYAGRPCESFPQSFARGSLLPVRNCISWPWPRQAMAMASPSHGHGLAKPWPGPLPGPGPL